MTSAHRAREGLEGLFEAEQSLHRQRLLAVAQCLAGIVVALDYQAVSLRGYGGLGQRHDQVPASRGVRGSTITGRSVSLLATMTAERSSVKRVLVSNVRMPRSQRTTLSPPEEVTYSAASSHSSTVAEPPLQNDAVVRARDSSADPLQQREVRHVAGPDLQDLRVLHDHLYVVGVHHLGDDLESQVPAHIVHDLQALLAEALEGVR